MATVSQTSEERAAGTSPGPSRILLRNISWAHYKRLRDEEENWHILMAYDGGNLELMSPSQKHDEIGYGFELFMVALAQALGFEFKALAHTTWQAEKAKKAKEADACYYIANYERIRG